jgi:biopolymer transport protein ExbD
MASVDTGGGDSGGKGKHGKKRAKKSSTHIDMTPMVDLAFLLLTFFVLTSTFSKPSVMELAMPSKQPVPPVKVKNILTIILDKSDTVYYYFGILDTTLSHVPYKTTDYSKDGLRKVMIAYNKAETEEQRSQGITYDSYTKVLDLEKKLGSDKKLDQKKKDSLLSVGKSAIWKEQAALMVVVKTYDDAKYGRVIDVMDELTVSYIDKKALLDMSNTEKAFLQKQKKK